MVFRKNIDPCCGYCKFSAAADPGRIICRKKGIKAETDHCRKFHYDPMKRVPARPHTPDFTKYDEKDYSL